jgi:hypothetical protein
MVLCAKTQYAVSLVEKVMIFLRKTPATQMKILNADRPTMPVISSASMCQIFAIRD